MARAPPGVLTYADPDGAQCTACEPVGELTGGNLHRRAARHGTRTACALLDSQRAPPGLRASWPELCRARGQDRLIGSDPRIIPRLAKGQTLVWLIKRELSDAAAKRHQAVQEGESPGGRVSGSG
jgi:hypothetical protein